MNSSTFAVAILLALKGLCNQLASSKINSYFDGGERAAEKIDAYRKGLSYLYYILDTSCKGNRNSPIKPNIVVLPFYPRFI